MRHCAGALVFTLLLVMYSTSRYGYSSQGAVLTEISRGKNFYRTRGNSGQRPHAGIGSLPPCIYPVLMPQRHRTFEATPQARTDIGPCAASFFEFQARSIPVIFQS